MVAEAIFGLPVSLVLAGLALKKRGLSHVVQPVWLPTIFWPGPFGWVQIFEATLFGGCFSFTAANAWCLVAKPSHFYSPLLTSGDITTTIVHVFN